MNSKTLTVVGGPNESEKTTFAQEYLKQAQQPYLSADLRVFRNSRDLSAKVA